MQLPAGRLSDRIDRRYVLAAMSAIAAFAGLLIFLLQPSLPRLSDRPRHPLWRSRQHALSDRCRPRERLRRIRGFRQGLGRLAAALRHRHDHRPDDRRSGHVDHQPHALFFVTALAHVLITVYAIISSRMRAAIPASDRDAYTTIPSANRR